MPQAVAAGQIEARETVPSFTISPRVARLPQGRCGCRGRSTIPVIASATSRAIRHARTSAADQLSEVVAVSSGVDRTAELLPWQGASDVERLSPVTVSARVLQHFREAWDHAHPQHPLAQQEIDFSRSLRHSMKSRAN